MRSSLLMALATATLLTSACSDEPAAVLASNEAPHETAPLRAHTATVPDWCAGHGLPESKCTKCNPELTAKFQAEGDWCAEHGFPESACPICNPQTAPGAVAGEGVADWCLEHGLPESKCSKCNPELTAKFQAEGDWCAEHGFPESACPVCNPQAPPEGVVEAALEARTVRFGSPSLERTVDVRTEVVRRAQGGASVACTARIAFDADRLAEVRAVVPGVVREVRADLGERVQRGQPLFVLESTRVGELQGALQTARERARTAEANLVRQRQLLASQIASPREVELAAQELAAARGAARSAAASLRMAGAEAGAPSGRFTLKAPLAGTLIHRPAILGAFASGETSLATVADTSVMWALCEVPEAEAARVAPGQRMRIDAGAGASRGLEGTLTWIAAEVNPRTRTVTVRAEVENAGGRLRANQFANARIETGSQQAGLWVPRDAVQRAGDREVVFVRAGEAVYEPRVVRRSLVSGDLVRVEGRLREGDAVVTTGAVLLRTELLPGSIGAGCCEPMEAH